jgi:hypothetical protein
VACNSRRDRLLASFSCMALGKWADLHYPVFPKTGPDLSCRPGVGILLFSPQRVTPLSRTYDLVARNGRTVTAVGSAQGRKKSIPRPAGKTTKEQPLNLALGAGTNFFNLPGVNDSCLTVKTIGDAVSARAESLRRAASMLSANSCFRVEGVASLKSPRALVLEPRFSCLEPRGNRSDHGYRDPAEH